MNSRIQKLLEEAEGILTPEDPPLKEASSIEIIAKNIDQRISEAERVWNSVYWEGYKPAESAAKDFAATADSGAKERKPRDMSKPAEKKVSDTEKVANMKTRQIVLEIGEIATNYNKTVKENLLKPAAKLRSTAEKIIEELDYAKANHKEIIDPVETLLKPLYQEFYTEMKPAVNKYYATTRALSNRIDEIMRRAGIEVASRQRETGAKKEGQAMLTTTEYREKLVTTVEGTTKIITHGEKFAEKYESVADLAVELGRTLPPEGVGDEAPPEPKVEVPADEGLRIPSSEMPVDGIDMEEKTISVASSAMPMDGMEE